MDKESRPRWRAEVQISRQRQQVALLQRAPPFGRWLSQRPLPSLTVPARLSCVPSAFQFIVATAVDGKHQLLAHGQRRDDRARHLHFAVLVADGNVVFDLPRAAFTHLHRCDRAGYRILFRLLACSDDITDCRIDPAVYGDANRNAHSWISGRRA